jgi:hypothetical protein
MTDITYLTKSILLFCKETPPILKDFTENKIRLKHKNHFIKHKIKYIIQTKYKKKE